MDHEIAVDVKDLTRTFGSFVAVDHITFRVHKGEIFGFLGPNGAGKTTTIKILCGLLTPTSGKAVVSGWDVSTEYEELKKHIGYMSQKFSLYEELTVQENLDFFGAVYGVPYRRKAERDNWVLEMAGLTERRDSLTGDLPLGWKQRLALGSAVIHEPAMLFLDEPTSGVDPLSRRSFWELIHDMARQGVTVFVSTHYMEEAEYCNRLALMSRGRIIALGSPSELKTEWMTDDVLKITCDNIMLAMETLQAHAEFEETAVFGAALHTVVKDAESAKEPAQRILEEVGVHVRAIETVMPSLEDVFVTLTAKDRE